MNVFYRDVKDKKVEKGEEIFKEKMLEAFKLECPICEDIFRSLANDNKSIENCSSCPLNGACMKQYLATIA